VCRFGCSYRDLGRFGSVVVVVVVVIGPLEGLGVVVGVRSVPAVVLFVVTVVTVIVWFGEPWLAAAAGSVLMLVFVVVVCDV
jgi:hypothetical protein